MPAAASPLASTPPHAGRRHGMEQSSPSEASVRESPYEREETMHEENTLAPTSFRYLFVLVLTIAILSITSCSIHAAAPSGNTTTPSEMYLKFRELVNLEKYEEAFAFLDNNARLELRISLTAVLGMLGMPSSEVKTVPDFVLFKAVMQSQTPHQIHILSEDVHGDLAILQCRIDHQGQIQNVEITLKKIDGI